MNTTATKTAPAEQSVILLIDDNESNIAMLVRYLEEEGFRTITARNGVMGIKRAQFARPDLILLDVMMPEMDGFEVCRRLKVEPATRDIPVIFMTALHEVEEKLKGFAAGGVDYITKPIHHEEVLVRIRTHLRLQAQQQQLQQQAEELRQTKEEAESARRLAERANAAKSEFLANMSHELRSPLNAVLGFSQLLRHAQNLTREQQEHLDLISRSGEHLLTLLDQVLDLSKIEAGHMIIEEQDIQLESLVQEVIELFRMRAGRKGLGIYFEPASETPQWVRTDALKLRQILINLLSNAVKFTEQGSVTVKIENCRLKSEDSSIANLQFSIIDTGPGIAPEEVDDLFDAFTQTSTGRRTPGGTGLGLAISHKFVRLLGGTIQVASQVGQGTTFTVELPVHPVATPPPYDAQQTQQRVIGLAPEQPTYRLLIVDDHQDNRQLLVNLLRPLGFEVQEAEHGQEAVTLWAQWRPHLIWMDMRMPVMDGYEAVRSIRNEEERMRNEASENPPHLDSRTPLSRMPIIALTAVSFTKDHQAMLLAGCDDVLRKPFRDIDLFGMLEKHLGVRFVYESSSTPESPEERPVRNIDISRALAQLPPDLLAELKFTTRIADIKEISILIDRIRAHDATLAEALNDLMQEFDYARIFAYVEQAEQL